MRKTKIPSTFTQENIQIYYLSGIAFSCNRMKVKKEIVLLKLRHRHFPWKIKGTNYKQVSATLSTLFVYIYNTVSAVVRDQFISLQQRVFV